MFDLLFSMLLSDPKAWVDPRSLVWYLSAVGATYVVGFVPSQEKELAPKHVGPLGLSISSYCLSFLLCIGC